MKGDVHISEKREGTKKLGNKKDSKLSKVMHFIWVMHIICTMTFYISFLVVSIYAIAQIFSTQIGIISIIKLIILVLAILFFVIQILAHILLLLGHRKNYTWSMMEKDIRKLIDSIKNGCKNVGQAILGKNK